MNSEVGMI